MPMSMTECGRSDAATTVLDRPGCADGPIHRVQGGYDDPPPCGPSNDARAVRTELDGKHVLMAVPVEVTAAALETDDVVVQLGPVHLHARLFTATLVARAGCDAVHAFHASLARDGSEVAHRLILRFGTLAHRALIVDGFDPTDPLVEALVAPAVADALIHIAEHPRSPLAAGLDLNVEQRFRD